jgi:hypothetical protein
MSAAMTTANPYAAEDHSLPEGDLATDQVRPDGVVVYSLTAHALQAMERHKWIESKQAGRDLGVAVLHDWLDRYWIGWVRSKLVEHFFGIRCWGAFSERDFGLLIRSTIEHNVTDAIIRETCLILGNGGENLDVIDWAISNAADLNAVLWLLDRIDINARRQRLLTNHIRLFI